MIVHRLLAFSLSWIWYYFMFKSSGVAYWKPSNFNNITLILGIGYGLRLNYLSIFLSSLRKYTQFDLGLGCAKDGATHSGSFTSSRTYSRNKCPTSFFNISSCTFVTVYGFEHIGFAPSFHVKSTRSILQVPSVSSNNSSNFCNDFRNSLRYVSVRCWHWFVITLFKYLFYYLSSKITRNRLFKVRTFSN